MALEQLWGTRRLDGELLSHPHLPPPLTSEGHSQGQIGFVFPLTSWSLSLLIFAVHSFGRYMFFLIKILFSLTPFFILLMNKGHIAAFMAPEVLEISSLPVSLPSV